MTIILNNYEDFERNSYHVYHRMESVFDKSKKEANVGDVCDEYPVRTKLVGQRREES